MIIQNPIFIFLGLGLGIFVYWFADRHTKQPSVRFSSLAQIRTIQSASILRSRKIPLLLRAVTIVLIGLALSHPRQGVEETRVSSEGLDIMLVLDASTSMLAEDFTINGKRINRLEVVKDVVSRFVLNRPYDRIGATVFAGRPYTLCPLTMDKNVLATFIERARIGLVEDGTAVGSAIVTAAKRLSSGKAKSKVIILLTDGRSNAGNIDPEAAAELAAKLGIKIYTIGAGSKGPVPYPGTDMFGRKGYQMVEIELDEKSLQAIADKTGGKYFNAKDTKSLEKIYDQIDKLEKTEIEETVYADFFERFRIFLIPAFLLLLLEIILRLSIYRTLP